MSNLTEQWKKGELPEGWYWVKIKTWCECIDGLYYTSDIFLDGDVPVDNDKITEVLAKVPDYEEWKQLKEQINKCYLDAINRGTANTVKAVKEFGMPERIKQLVEQNAQLKDLLKECELWFTGMVGNMNDKNVGEHNKSVPIGNFEHIFKEFSQKIKGALK